MNKQRIGTMRAMESTWRRIIVPALFFFMMFQVKFHQVSDWEQPEFQLDNHSFLPSYYQMCIYIPQIPPNRLKVGPFSEMGRDSRMLFSHKIWTNELHAALVFALLFQIHHTRCGLSQHRDQRSSHYFGWSTTNKMSQVMISDTQHLTEKTTFVKRQTNKDLSCESATGYTP